MVWPACSATKSTSEAVLATPVSVTSPVSGRPHSLSGVARRHLVGRKPLHVGGLQLERVAVFLAHRVALPLGRQVVADRVLVDRPDTAANLAAALGDARLAVGLEEGLLRRAVAMRDVGGVPGEQVANFVSGCQRLRICGADRKAQRGDRGDPQ